MILFHGTSMRVVENHVLTPTGGLRPRDWDPTRRPSLWAAASDPRSVYLTDAYAPHFSHNAAAADGSDPAVIVIDTSLLPPTNHMPRWLADEDALEQAGRGRDGVPGRVPVRTRRYRDDLAERALLAGCDHRWSLRVLGTCRHVGPIPRQAVTRVISWVEDLEGPMRMLFDPSITIANYQFCGARYRWLSQKMAQIEVTEQLKPIDLLQLGGRSGPVLGLLSSLRVQEVM